MFCVDLKYLFFRKSYSKYLLQDLIHKLNILLNLLDLDTINYLIKHQRHTSDALNSPIQLSFGLWSCCTKFSIRHLRLLLMWKNAGIDKSLMLKISLSHMTRNKKHSPQLPFLRIYVIYGKPVGTGHLIIYHSCPSIFLIMIGSCNTYANVALNKITRLHRLYAKHIIF